MNSVTFTWKEFYIPLDKLSVAIGNLLGSNFDGLICSEDDFMVVFKEIPTQTELDDLNNFWDNVTESQFDPSLREIISKSINEAMIFGQTLILDAAVENVEMGITQAGKTAEVADYCADLQRYLDSGSLYAAISKIDSLISAGVPSELSPFITEARLLEYKGKIESYLGII